MSHLASPYARVLGPSPRPVVAISRADAMRVEQLVYRTSPRGACLILNIGGATLEAARDEGTMRPETLARIREALDVVDGWGQG